MKVPVQETIYVNPDIYQGETGASPITNLSTSNPIVYGENPNANQPILIPIAQSGSTTTTLIDSEIQPIKTTTASTTTNPKGSTTATPIASTTATPSASTTIVPSASTTATPSASSSTSKKSKYLLYGGGALVVGYIVYKLVKK
jgi:hypothetical protein